MIDWFRAIWLNPVEDLFYCFVCINSFSVNFDNFAIVCKLYMI